MGRLQVPVLSQTPLFPEIIVNSAVIPSAANAAEAPSPPSPKGKPGLAWRMAARALSIRNALLDQSAPRAKAATPVAVGPVLTETTEAARLRCLAIHAELTA